MRTEPTGCASGSDGTLDVGSTAACRSREVLVDRYKPLLLSESNSSVGRMRGRLPCRDGGAFAHGIPDWWQRSHVMMPSTTFLWHRTFICLQRLHAALEVPSRWRAFVASLVKSRVTGDTTAREVIADRTPNCQEALTGEGGPASPSGNSTQPAGCAPAAPGVLVTTCLCALL